MEVFKTKKDVVSYCKSMLHNHKTIGFVPTMGALHAGHLELVHQAKSENNVVIASVFVNPMQFNNPQDLEKYPRMPEEDMRMLQRAGCHAVFFPEVNEMYDIGEQGLNLDLGMLDKVMEGAFRPGHFKGVITIVDKFFRLIQPSAVYLGEKDFQQLAVIRFMGLKLHPEIKIVGCPTVRERDGLAMSSRNLRITPTERAVVPVIYRSLQDGVQWKNEFTVQEVKNKIILQVNHAYPLKVEYFDIVDAGTLQSIEDWSETAQPRGCIAVLTTTVRLIDNIAF